MLAGVNRFLDSLYPFTYLDQHIRPYLYNKKYFLIKNMNIFYFLYRVSTLFLFSGLLFPFLLFILITGKYRKHFNERLGAIPEESLKDLSGAPRIWIHAVSLGEIKVACSIISTLRELMPGSAVLLSTNTEHGRNLALEMLGERIPIIYAPVDVFLFVRKALKKINPDVLIFLETEIWPSWIIEARSAGVKIALLNGRISGRSLKNYLRFKPFFKNILSNFDTLSMISEEDKKHIMLIGADPEKTLVNGNAKYDMLIHQTEPGMNENVRRLFDIDPDIPVIVAGSTRTGEEEILLDAFRNMGNDFPDAVLIIAPRHIERVKDIIEILRKRSLGYHLRSEFGPSDFRREQNIIIIDCYGELFNIYSAANIAFCGASLVPLGGQNPLEPAAWGTPVFHGPHMDDFLDATGLLKRYDASIEVTDHIDLSEKAVFLLKRPELLRQKGILAKKALTENRGASEKHARVIADFINNSNQIQVEDHSFRGK